MTRNPHLIIPDTEDDAFFDYQSQRSGSVSRPRNSTIVGNKRSPSHEESKDTKFSSSLQRTQASSSQSIRRASTDISGQFDGTNHSKQHVRASMPPPSYAAAKMDNAHVGN